MKKWYEGETKGFILRVSGETLVKAASLTHTPKQTLCLVAVDTARRWLLQSAKAEEVLS